MQRTRHTGGGRAKKDQRMIKQQSRKLLPHLDWSIQRRSSRQHLGPGTASWDWNPKAPPDREPWTRQSLKSCDSEWSRERADSPGSTKNPSLKTCGRTNLDI